jgi:hypothetical protein
MAFDDCVALNVIGLGNSLNVIEPVSDTRRRRFEAHAPPTNRGSPKNVIRWHGMYF